MLVSFSVENWMCFRDRQEFSLETVGRVPDEFAFDTEAARYPRLNRVAAIYGPNGSGKSCFVEALSFVRDFVIESAKGTQAGDGIDIEPFRFDLRSSSQPASFEIAFIEGGAVYELGFAADTERIWEEWLYVRPPGGRLQRWFSRSFDPGSKNYEWSFGPSLRGPRGMWRRATRPDALYVSTAVQLNSDSLRPIVDWFRNLTIVDSDGPSPESTSERLRTDPNFRTRLIEFLRQADIPFSDIRVEEEIDLGEEVDLDEVPLDLREMFETLLNRLKDTDHPKIPIPEFGLPVAGADTLAYLGLDELSDGTGRVYSLAASWLDVIDHGRTIVVDELERSLHPHLVRFLTGLINRPGRPRNQRAQLVVTMHDTVLLREGLDRNQIWLTEKGPDQAARLTSLSSYRPRKDESLLNGYLGGRYGAVPNIAETELAD